MFGHLKQQSAETVEQEGAAADAYVLAALDAQPMSMDELLTAAREEGGSQKSLADVAVWGAKQVCAGRIARYADGRYGPVLLGGR